MKIDKLKTLFLHLVKWERHNRDRIGKPIRTKHFIEDLALIIHFFEEDGFDDDIIKIKRKSCPTRLAKLFGVKILPMEVQKR